MEQVRTLQKGTSVIVMHGLSRASPACFSRTVFLQSSANKKTTGHSPGVLWVLWDRRMFSTSGAAGHSPANSAPRIWLCLLLVISAALLTSSFLIFYAVHCALLRTLRFPQPALILKGFIVGPSQGLLRLEATD